MKQCRVFLKSPRGELKKIYSIRADDKGKFIQAHVWSTIICKEFEIPLDSELHYQIPANGIDFHFSIKYNDRGPFEDSEIINIENYLSFYPNRSEYKHKQVIIKTDKITNSHLFPFTNELKPKFLLGYPPDSFDQYIKNKAQHPVYYLSTIATPIAPLSDQRLKEGPWNKGDKSKTPPLCNDIVIEESDEPDARITVCGFIGCPGYFSQENTSYKSSRVVSIPGLPDFGISVIFCHKLPKT